MTRFPSDSRLTPACRRVVQRCRRLVEDTDDSDIWSGHLLLALLLDESLASAGLTRLGIDRNWLQAGHLGDDVATTAAMLGIADGSMAFPPEFYASGDCQDNRATSTGRNADGADPVTLAELESQIRQFEAQDDNSAATPSDAVRETTDPDCLISIIDRAISISRRWPGEDGVTSSHLLLALVEVSETIRRTFQNHGIELTDITNELGLSHSETTERLAVSVTLSLDGTAHNSIKSFDHDSGAPTNAHPNFIQPSLTSPPTVEAAYDAVWRLIDANLNRCREGFRVLEDHCRFVGNDATVSRLLKSLRHELVAAEQELHPREQLLRFRNTDEDVGTSITVNGEASRSTVNDVVIANCRRVQESLRSLEEFGKLVSPNFAACVKQIRYQMYTAEIQIHGTLPASHRDSPVTTRIDRLHRSQLYVLITEKFCRLPWKTVVTQALEGGADVLQLREKNLNDRELLKRATWLVSACREHSALSIINDRPDIAVASDADGVHVGQEELTVDDIRLLTHRDRLIGVSTHNISQLEEAVACGADYAGVGPTFPTATKSFESHAGLEFVSAAAQWSKSVLAGRPFPWFAIGGITEANVARVTEAGAERLAVTGAVVASESPSDVCAAFVRILKGR
ncbi:MAG: thiamine phosphate synthase [Planctomycetaceae bacterium]